MRTVTKIAGTALLLALTGCSTLSSLNPFASKPEPRNPPAALVEFTPSLNVRTAWSSKIGNAAGFAFTPAATESGIFAAAADGTLLRLDAADGRPVWRINTGVPLRAGVGSDGTTVAVAGREGLLLAYDRDGKPLWQAQASSEVLAAPAVGAGLVVARSVDNRIAGFDALSGERRWIVQRPAPPLSLRASPGILISGSTAYVGLSGGRLTALNLSNGAVRWEVIVAEPRGTTELERIADISGTPVLAGRDVCTVAYRGRIACFDAATGTPRWGRELSSEVGLDADERLVFAADERGTVMAFAREGGAPAWRNVQLGNRRLSKPVVYGKAVAVGDGWGYVHFLSRENGNLLARVSTDGSAVIGASPVAGGPGVILQTQAGTLVALATD